MHQDIWFQQIHAFLAFLMPVETQNLLLAKQLCVGVCEKNYK